MYDLRCTEIWYATMQKINVGFRSQSRRCYNVGLWRLKTFIFNQYPTSVSDVVSTSIQRQLFAGMVFYEELWSSGPWQLCDTTKYNNMSDEQCDRPLWTQESS